MRRLLLPLVAALLLPAVLPAQDTTRVQDAIRIGITYRPGVRPVMVVIPGPGADSLRAIIQRDLDFSDRFEMVPVPLMTAAGTAGRVNYQLYRTQFHADFGVEIAPVVGGVTVRLHDMAQQRVRDQGSFGVPSPGDPDFRLAVHRIADRIVQWAAGAPGYAASRLTFVSGGRLYRVDSDGADETPLSPPGQTAFSSAWSPDGRRVAWTRLADGTGSIVVQDLATGANFVAPGTATGLNYAQMFSPDGRTLAYARSDESGATNIFIANVAQRCCVQRLTAGTFADNLSPSYSPDGRRIAFVSTRAGPPEIYVMTADGTDQEVFAPFDYGATGASYAPEWSPDGATVVFHREVQGTPQIFLLDVATQRVRQVTSVGRSEDATWAPDSRHIAFISTRSGQRQIWVVDTETGRVRQVRTPGSARLPEWSPRL